jgi:hypothetical protein
VVSAAKGQPSKVPALPPRLPLEPAPSVPAQGASAVTKPTPSGPGGGDWIALGGLGAMSLGMLALGLLAASRARKAKRTRPPKRTAEGGRQRGRALAPRTAEQAFVALGEARVGALLEAVAIPGGARVMVERPRSHPCEEVSGLIAGLFESVHAMDVRVDHAQCAGRAGPCRYVVTRADFRVRVEPRPSASAARAEAASTPGWSAAARQSPRARGGAG